MEGVANYSEIRKSLDEKRLTCTSLVQHYLKKIEEGRHLNAITESYPEEALQQAELVDKKLQEGRAGRLAGMVITIKDVLSHLDHTLTCSSKILEGFQAQFTGTAVQRLLDEDAIIIGRTNCDEFAMGSSNENSAYGPVFNADDTDRVPGGSSGGAAVSVQAGMCLVALGTDTGGSVRQPAAFCGLVGLKPSYGRISRYGLAAYASSFDTVGIFSTTIEDNALVLEVMAGEDDFDSTASKKPVSNYTAHLAGDRKYKIGYIAECLESRGLDPEVKKKTEDVIQQLKDLGHEVEPVKFPLLDYVLPTYYILTTAEASSNLSRYDGVRYGYRSGNSGTLESMYKNTRTEGFGAEVKRRILLGTFVLSASYYDAYYTKAQKVRRLIQQSTLDLLENHDVLISPTTPSTAFRIGEKQDDPIQMYLADLFTVQASVSGLPAISVPCGRDSKGLSIGIQVVGDFFNETGIYQVGQLLMQNN